MNSKLKSGDRLVGQLVKVYGTGRNFYGLKLPTNSSSIIVGSDHGLTDADLGNTYSFEIIEVKVTDNYTSKEAYNLIKQY